MFILNAFLQISRRIGDSFVLVIFDIRHETSLAAIQRKKHKKPGAIT
jgi:hypothetical protein